MAEFTVSREDLAWAAGIFDGEGNARGGLRTKARRREITATVAQSHEELPDRFQSVVGVGAVRGPYKPKTPNGLPYWVWGASRLETVQHVAAVLWPWLGSVKRQQFAVAITAYLGAIPDYLLCPHGVPSRSCPPCRSERTRLGWEKRPRHYAHTDRDEAIRTAFSRGESRQAIAARTGVSYGRVCQIVRGV